MRSAIHTEGAPEAIGPYSQAILAAGVLFCSGQIALDPSTGTLVEGPIAQQTERALDNLRAVLDQAGCSFADVVKTTVFLVSMDDFAAMNEVYARYFPDPAPARSTVAVSALPKGASFEIEAIALVPRSS